MKLAKSGYYNGDPEKVLRARVDHVIAAFEYECFCTDYENAYIEMNKETGR